MLLKKAAKTGPFANDGGGKNFSQDEGPSSTVWPILELTGILESLTKKMRSELGPRPTYAN